MTKSEITELINSIYLYYPGFAYGKDPIDVVKKWYVILKDCDYTKVNNNLQVWTKSHDKPPSISDLYVSDWKKEYIRL